MYYYILGGIMLALGLWAFGSYLAVRNIEEPKYTVLEKKADYEIRLYEPYIVAEATVDGPPREALSRGFSLVADYIFGNNTATRKIAMTAPVLEAEAVSEKIAMTVPVLDTETEDEKRTIAFVLPSEYTVETLPAPNNNRVSIRAIPAQKMAALSYTWYGTPGRVASKKARLIKLLERDGLVLTDTLQSAFYNPPLSMPLMLRNEILAPIE